MKNLHLLPTDKPSRLHLWTDKNGTRLELCELEYSHTRNTQHIYITNDEEIKEGNWYFKDVIVGKCDKYPDIINGYNVKKIILTTDQDLIKDGVQAIDDEFLEWFVKNPSCEKVETFIDTMGCSLESCDGNPCVNYKITIPKEELKQETNLDKHLASLPEYSGSRRSAFVSKQETLEEAAHQILVDYGVKSIGESIGVLSVKKLMVNFAKWQAERMYSEQDLREAFNCARHIGRNNIAYEFDEWFDSNNQKSSHPLFYPMRLFTTKELFEEFINNHFNQ